MNKLLTLLLALLMVVSVLALASCGDKTPDDPDVQTPEDQNPDEQDPDGEDPDTQDPNEQDPDVQQPQPTDEDWQEANNVIDRINKIEQITADTWEAMEKKIGQARSAYDKLTDIQKTLIDAALVEKLQQAEEDFASFKANFERISALTVNKIVTATPIVDGQVDPYYMIGNALVLEGATVRFAYDENNCYVVAVVDGADAVSVQLTLNDALAGGIVLGAADVKKFSASSPDAVTAEYSYQATAIDGGYIAECAIPLSSLGLADTSFDKNEVGATFAYGTQKHVGYDSLQDCQRFYVDDTAFYHYVATGTPTIDGELDDLYSMASEIVLSREVINGFTPEQVSQGGGHKGDTSIFNTAAMSTSFRMLVDDKYLYIAEHRIDMTPIFDSNALAKPFRGDGSFLWFSKDNDLGAGICWHRAMKDHAGPTFGLFFDNQQSKSSATEWQYAIKHYGSSCEYVMEVRIPLSDLELTREDFEQGRVSFTFCSSDVVDPDYNAASFDWTGTAYQMNYVGLGTLGADQTDFPVLVVNVTEEKMNDIPKMTGEYRPDCALELDVWDAFGGKGPKPFEDFPTDPATGYFKPSEWSMDDLNRWYAVEYADSVKYQLTGQKDRTFAEGITLTPYGDPNWRSDIGYYCDPVGSSLVIAVDLTKYKDAMLTVSTGVNYYLEVSVDGENWTRLYDYLAIFGTSTEDWQSRHGVAIDSAVYAKGADTMYVRIGQANTSDGYGAALGAFTVFYN